MRIHRLRCSGSDVTSLVRKFTTTSVGCLVGVTTPTTVFAAATTTITTTAGTIGVTTIEHRQRHTVWGGGGGCTCGSNTPTRSLILHIVRTYVRSRTCVYSTSLSPTTLAACRYDRVRARVCVCVCMLATLSPFYLEARASAALFRSTQHPSDSRRWQQRYRGETDPPRSRSSRVHHVALRRLSVYHHKLVDAPVHTRVQRGQGQRKIPNDDTGLVGCKRDSEEGERRRTERRATSRSREGYAVLLVFFFSFPFLLLSFRPLCVCPLSPSFGQVLARIAAAAAAAAAEPVKERKRGKGETRDRDGKA